MIVIFQKTPPEIAAGSVSAPSTPKTPVNKSAKKLQNSTPAETTSEGSDEDTGDLVIDEAAGKGKLLLFWYLSLDFILENLASQPYL